MPRLLRKDTIRLLRASQEALAVALFALACPVRQSTREEEPILAPIIGLIGAAAELALSACVVQAFGPEVLLDVNGRRYKSGPQILSEFRRMLKLGKEMPQFLAQGIDDTAAHAKMLLEKTSRFRTLFVARAAGLHGGSGPSRDVCAHMALHVAEFLDLLGRSERLKPYLSSVPRPPEPSRELTVIADELLARVSDSQSSSRDKAQALASLYLVFADIPDDGEPDWLPAFEKVHAVPRERDVVLLTSFLSRAIPAQFIRSTGSGVGFPVRYAPDDPVALPISPQFLRREFTEIPEQWHADVAAANGRLKQGLLDLPPYDFVLDLFALGLDIARILPGASLLPAQQTWPFVAASLNVQGTPGPVWFLIRKTKDHEQLRSFLDRACRYGPPGFQANVRTVLAGIAYLSDGSMSEELNELVRWAVRMLGTGHARRDQLPDLLSQKAGTVLEAPPELRVAVTRAVEGDVAIGDVLRDISEGRLLNESSQRRKYWTRILAEAATDQSDVPGLVSVLRSAELKSAHTACRKNLRLIDLVAFGPELGLT